MPTASLGTTPTQLDCFVPRFVKISIECYIYDANIPEIVQFVFYASILQESITFNSAHPW